MHQDTYIMTMLKRFYMNKSHPLYTPMIVRSLYMYKDPFRPQENDEELLDPKVPYLKAIRTLLYLVNYTLPNITFAINLPTRYSFSLTQIYWNGVEHILCYLRITTNIDLFY